MFPIFFPGKARKRLCFHYIHMRIFSWPRGIKIIVISAINFAIGFI